MGSRAVGPGEGVVDGVARIEALLRQVLEAGCSVVVANTFTRRWEMEQYLKAANKRGVNVRIVEATGNWSNVHGVPADAIERMRARWEPIGEGEYNGHRCRKTSTVA